MTIEYSSRREVRAERACWRVGKLQDTELNILATMREITMRTIKATVQEIEKFIREYGLHSTITKVERVRGLTSFRLTDTVEDDTGKKTGVEWANILVIEKDEGTEVIKQFNADYIYKSFKDGERRAQFIDGYRDTLNTLHAEIIEHFEQEKPEEPAEIVDPLVAARREKVKELSAKGKTIEAIAKGIPATRSTVIRDRDILGITKKRKKRR